MIRRFSALVLAVLACSCYSDPRPIAEQSADSEFNAIHGEVDVRERQASERILDVLVKHSVSGPAMIDACFSSTGEVLRCEVELRGSAPLKAEKEALVQEVCAIVKELGHPEPPKSLSFQVSFSTPLILSTRRSEPRFRRALWQLRTLTERGVVPGACLREIGV